MLFDAHLHVVDPRFPLVPSDGYRPPDFDVEQYRRRVAPLGVTGGAVVAASFQGVDQTWLLDALDRLGPTFAGVAQLPPDAPDEQVLALDAAGVRAVRVNVRRGGGAGAEHLDRLARRVFELAGWHVEVYADAAALAGLAAVLGRLPAACVDHLGLSSDGLPVLLRLVEQGVRVKASGFGRYEGDVAAALRAVARLDPGALVFGTDLPSTRAPRPFRDSDVDLLRAALGPDLAGLALAENGRRLYRVPATA